MLGELEIGNSDMRIFLQTITIAFILCTPSSALEENSLSAPQIESKARIISLRIAFPHTARVDDELRALNLNHDEEDNDTIVSRTFDKFAILFSVDGVIYIAENALKTLAYFLGAGWATEYLEAYNSRHSAER